MSDKPYQSALGLATLVATMREKNLEVAKKNLAKAEADAKAAFAAYEEVCEDMNNVLAARGSGICAFMSSRGNVKVVQEKRGERDVVVMSAKASDIVDFLHFCRDGSLSRMLRAEGLGTVADDVDEALGKHPQDTLNGCAA